jgi:hypothetical protein
MNMADSGDNLAGFDRKVPNTLQELDIPETVAADPDAARKNKSLELEDVPFQASLFHAANLIFRLGKSFKAPSAEIRRWSISSAMYLRRLASCLNSSVESPFTTSLA